MEVVAGFKEFWPSILIYVLIILLAARFLTVAAFFTRLLSGRFTFSWFKDRFQGMAPKPTSTILLAIALLLLVFVSFWLREQFLIDRCLDAGGLWNSKTQICER